jgi:hypothetical protein
MVLQRSRANLTAGMAVLRNLLLCSVAAICVAANSEFTLLDSRPVADGRDGYLSIARGDCDAWTFRVGDHRTQKPRLDALQADLAAQLGSGVRVGRIEVTHYAIFINRGVRVNNGTPDHGYHEERPKDWRYREMGSACEPERTHGGYYAPWEATTNFSPVIVEIAGNLDGKPFASRSVYSPALELQTGKLELPRYATVLTEAMRMAHVELVAVLRAQRTTE